MELIALAYFDITKIIKNGVHVKFCDAGAILQSYL